MAVAQSVARLSSDKKIPGSNPASCNLYIWLFSGTDWRQIYMYVTGSLCWRKRWLAVLFVSHVRVFKFEKLDATIG